MEIKLSAGDTIQVPAGCNATIKGNKIVIEKKQEFKDGDILHSTLTNRILIFKNYNLNNNNENFSCYYSNLDKDNFDWVARYFRHATEEEKQHFFDELKAKGLRWNAETKEMEKVRKRAKNGETYLYIDGVGLVNEFVENDDCSDYRLYNLGNYYLLSERKEAEEDAKAIRAIFEKRKKVE